MDDSKLLFDDERLEASEKVKLKAGRPLHAQMLSVYGHSEGAVCGDCIFLRDFTYKKCTKAKVTSGSATDWRKKWLACGLFQTTKGKQ